MSSSSSSSLPPFHRHPFHPYPYHQFHHHHAMTASAVFGSARPNPTDGLLDRLCRRDWDAARHRVLTYPWDAAYTTTTTTSTTDSNSSSNNRSSTVLHVACQWRAPADLIRMICNAYPEALWMQDAQGWTPLHIHILYGITTATTTTTSNIDQEDGTAAAAEEEEESVTEFLIRRGGPVAVRLQDDPPRGHGMLGGPLHLACRHATPTAGTFRLLQWLLAVAPEQVVTPVNSSSNSNNNNHAQQEQQRLYPATLLYQTYQRLQKQQLQQQQAATANSNSNAVEQQKQRLEQALLQQFLLLVSAVVSSPSSSSSSSRARDRNNNMMHRHHPSLHDIIVFCHKYVMSQQQQQQARQASFSSTNRTTVAHCAAKEYIRLYLAHYPNSVYEWQEGNLPLHIAASWGGGSNTSTSTTTAAVGTHASPHNAYSFLSHWPQQQQPQPPQRDAVLALRTALAAAAKACMDNDILVQVLKRHPAAASQPNALGRLPLHLFLMTTNTTTSGISSTTATWIGNDDSGPSTSNTGRSTTPAIASNHHNTHGGELLFSQQQPEHGDSYHDDFALGRLQLLIQAYPTALTIPDPQSGLYAFQLAAATAVQQENDVTATAATGRRRRAAATWNHHVESTNSSDTDAAAAVAAAMNLNGILHVLRAEPHVLRLTTTSGTTRASSL